MPRTNLHKVELSQAVNKYCGPSAIAAIANISTDEAAKILSDITGRNPITWAYLSELAEAFKQLGYNTVYLKHLNGSLFYVLSVMTDAGTYVIAVPGHFITIEVTEDNQRYICDNHTKQPINAGMSARLSQQVKQVMRVWK